ncbi:hypothetical protein QE250_11300 [Chromatiaceae bacterium AAb-1]|nr:hypothetical protein [Chromatiaceae bacterium AAb-1]
MQWQHLKKRQLITEQQGIDWLNAAGLNSDSINLLARTNFKRLSVYF